MNMGEAINTASSLANGTVRQHLSNPAGIGQGIVLIKEVSVKFEEETYLATHEDAEYSIILEKEEPCA